MASKDSEELGINDRYPLGEYSFRLERSSGTSPNYDKIEAICTKGGKNARKSIQIPSSTQMSGWYVEANDTTADVYAVIKVPEHPEEGEYYSGLDTSPVTKPIPAGAVSCVYDNNPSEADRGNRSTDVWGGAIAAVYFHDSYYKAVFASASPSVAVMTTTLYSKQDGTSTILTTSDN